MQKQKIISLFLVFCLLLALMPSSPRASAAEAENPIQEQPQTDLTPESAPIDEEQVGTLTQSSQILKYVDANVFAANDHVARIPEEESLNTYVFRNEDGSKTVYYLSEDVKYISTDGTVLEKDLTLVQNAEGFGIVRSDIGYTLPNSASGGIGLSHGQKSVVLIPQNPNAKAGNGRIDGNSVRYPNYFGQGIHLVYTPIPSGLKEDIVLDSYTGVNSFTFLLCTNGLDLYQTEGRYYLAQAADSADKLYLGDIIVYDAKGEPSQGTMTAVTVKEGQQYRLTVTADTTFLTDPDTRYPVTIDPTLTVSDNTHGAGAIEDASIYSKTPNMNAANWTYNHSGYYDSTYGKCRTVYRLTKLLTDSGYQTATAANITSAKFYVKEATGSAGVTVNLHAMTNTSWTENGITWNNAGSYSSTVYASASPSYNNWANWDITTLVKAWKNNTQNPNAGFILVSTNETSIDKAFYACEHSSISDRPYVVVNYNVNTGGLNYTSKSVDEGSTFQLTWSGVSSGITWTSSNTSVATVNSSGKVTGVKAGTATITASKTGYTTVSCTVTVTLPYGIYYVNASSGISIGTGGTQTNLTPILTYTQITSGESKYYQLWEIKHISGGKYSIRSIGNGSLLLYRSGSSAVVYNSSPSASVPTAALWKIEYTSRGYKLLNNGSSSYALTVNGSDTGTGQFVNTATYSSTSAQAHWQLQILNGVVLLDADTRTVLPENFEKAIELGDDKNQGQLGIAAVRTGNGASSTGITWSSSDISVAEINSVTGNVTSKEYGETTITAVFTLNGTSYLQSYKLHVAKFISVINVYDMTVENNTQIRSNIDDAVAFLNTIYMDFNLYFTMDGNPIEHDNDPIVACNRNSTTDCSCMHDVYADACTYHHKNVHRIANELEDLYYTEDHIIISWSDCSVGVYCDFLNGDHTPLLNEVAITPMYESEEVMGTDRTFYPLALMLTFEPFSQDIFGNISIKNYMSLLLAHEVAHVLELHEIYSNSYGDCNNDDHRDTTNMHCLMGRFTSNIAAFYTYIVSGNSAFCDYCIAKLNAELQSEMFADQ